MFKVLFNRVEIKLINKVQVVANDMGRPRKIKSAKELESLWEAYKANCDNQMVLTHCFSGKNSEFVSKELRRTITYTIEGFCVFIGISRQAFYKLYAKDECFTDMVTRAKEEIEVDARKKFELGLIPSQLSGLWMSRYGYSNKTDSNIDNEQALNTLVLAIQESAKATNQ